MSMESEHLFI